MCRLFFNAARSILRVLSPFGMAESAASPKATAPKGTADEKAFNEFIPGNTPSTRTPQDTSEDGTNKKKTKQQNKPDFDNMPLNEKRSYYTCENNFLTLDHILPWPDYVKYNHYLFAERGLLRKNDKFHHDNDKINRKLSLYQGDITCLEVDAIVNAANTSLLGGGGVDGCIHRAAGKGLLKECRTLHGCKTGKAKITSGYMLPAKKVIHTVGPIGENKKRLQSCYESCLKLVKEHKLRTVVFCCISTGVYGYPYEKAATVAVETVKEWLEENSDEVDRVIFCVYLDSDLDVYHRLLLKYFPCTIATVEEDDDQGDSSMEEAKEHKEHSNTETIKGNEKRAKKTVGDGLGEGDCLLKPEAEAESKEEDAASSGDLDHDTKFNAAKGENKEDVGNKMQVDVSDGEEGDAGDRRAENSGLNEATENTRDDDDGDVEENLMKTVDEKVEGIDADREMKKRKRETDVEAKMDLDAEASEVVREDETPGKDR